MKVVLKQDVKSIGKKDELHEVSDGYARNYLLPRGLAVAADAAAVNEVRTKAAASEHSFSAKPRSFSSTILRIIGCPRWNCKSLLSEKKFAITSNFVCST